MPNENQGLPQPQPQADAEAGLIQPPGETAAGPDVVGTTTEAALGSTATADIAPESSTPGEDEGIQAPDSTPNANDNATETRAPGWRGVRSRDEPHDKKGQVITADAIAEASKGFKTGWSDE